MATAIHTHNYLKLFGFPLPAAVKAAYKKEKFEQSYRLRFVNAYLARFTCACCGKKRKGLEYHSSIDGFLCPACKRRILTVSESGCIDHQGLDAGRVALKAEQEASRAANKAYQAGPHSKEANTPAYYCPKCGCSKYVEHDGLFKREYYCSFCDQVFWVARNGTRIWQQDGAMYKAKPYQNHTLVTVHQDESHGICERCNKGGIVETTTFKDAVSGSTLTLCVDCLEEGVREGYVKPVNAMEPRAPF